MIILDSLFPVLLLIVGGYFLKKLEITNSVFLKTSDTLVYYIFFPLMLFWKIGGSSYGADLGWDLCLAGLSSLAVMFALSFVCFSLFRMSHFQRGSFGQSCYRFNTYIGMAVVLNSFGEEGVRLFGVLIGVAIPIINIVAVTTLIWFSSVSLSQKKRSTLVAKALLANPLIWGCAAGIIFSRTGLDFPKFIANSLSLVSMLTLPLALLSIGGSLSFAGLKQNFILSSAAAFLKLGVFPIVGFFFLHFFDVSGVAFSVGMIFFTLPTSTAIYVLSSQMNSDTDLASSAILVSTILSFPALTIALLL